MATGQTYTEAILEFADRLDAVEQRILTKLDAIEKCNNEFSVAQGKNESQFIAIDKRIDANRDDIKRIGGLNVLVTAIAASIAAAIGRSQ
jgi:hypothetical protein